MGNHFPLEGGTQGGSLHTQTFKEVTLKQFQKQNFQSALKGRDIIAMGAALRQEIQPTTLVVGFMRQQKLINRFNGLQNNDQSVLIIKVDCVYKQFILVLN